MKTHGCFKKKNDGNIRLLKDVLWVSMSSFRKKYKITYDANENKGRERSV
jgi:hypothetical protein